MRIRANTWDAKIVDDVLIRNEYGLPGDLRGTVILDIGAHIGSFALACQKRGARRIICYEPDPENVQLLAYNMDEDKDSRAEVIIVNAAVTGQHADDLGLRRLTDHDGDIGPNTGHIDVFGSAPDGTQGIAINAVIESVGEPIDLLKMDCEGAEWGIFEHGDFSKIRSIAAELHAVKDCAHRLLETVKGKSLADLANDAVRKLRASGFETSVIYNGIELAHLVATRTARVSVGDAAKPPRVLWIGDAVITTGCARVTENICRGLVRHGWDVRVLGIGYNGDPHSYPYKIYPAVDPNVGGHRNGLSRLADIMKRVKPDVVVVQDDSWNVGIVIDNMAMLNVLAPTVGYVAVDSENVREDIAVQLKNLRHTICHTQFGVDQLNAAGFTGKTSIAGHGVDLSLYTRYDKSEAREGLPLTREQAKNAFIWGVVAANQPRKRLDLTVAYFAEWWRRAGKPDNAYLYIHANEDGAWDLRQLASYCGIRGRIHTTEGGQVLTDAQMPTLYNAFDVMLSTSEGESFGIPLLEGMACGVPQIAVRCGGAPEWAGGPVLWVNPSQYAFTPNRTNTKRRIASEQDFIEAMNAMYYDNEFREKCAQACTQKAAEPQFRWENIAKHFDTTLRQVITAQRIATKASTDALSEF